MTTQSKGLKINERHSTQHGECCCTCKFQCTLFKHPWNTFLKGTMDESTGLYACLARYSLSGDAQGTIYESKHGLCELYTPKTQISQQTARIDPDPLQQYIKPPYDPEYDLEFCERCFVMSNHVLGVCQKCVDLPIGDATNPDIQRDKN